MSEEKMIQLIKEFREYKSQTDKEIASLKEKVEELEKELKTFEKYKLKLAFL